MICTICGPLPDGRVHAICHPIPGLSPRGCGHLLKDHAPGLRCKVCGQECGL